MNGYAVYDRVWTGEIDVLKNAGRGPASAAVLPAGGQTAILENQDFSRLQVPDKRRSHGGQGAALRGGHIGSVRHLTIAQGAEAVGVPGADQLLRGHEHQGIGSLQAVHGPAESLLDGRRGQALLGDNIGNRLRVAGGVEDGAGQLQLIPEGGGVAEIAVMGNGHVAFLVIDLDGLAVLPVGGPGGAVTGVPHRHGPPGKPVQGVLAEHIPHQTQVLIGGENAVVIDHNAAALLAPVLEGVKPVVGQPPHVGGLWSENAEYAALFMNSHKISSPVAFVN